MSRVTLFVLMAFSVGCASANLTVVKPLAAPLHEASLTVEPTAQMTAEQQSRLRTLLTTSLSEAGVTVRSSEVGRSELAGQVVEYRPGNRALRYFIGFGAGKGRFGSNWRVVDGSGEEVGSCRIDGSIVMGGFGGSYDDVLEKVGQRLGEFLGGPK